MAIVMTFVVNMDPGISSTSGLMFLFRQRFVRYPDIFGCFFSSLTSDVTILDNIGTKVTRLFLKLSSLDWRDCMLFSQKDTSSRTAQSRTIVCSQLESSTKNPKIRQQIRIDYYVTRVVNQSESSITSHDSSWVGLKTLLGWSRLAIAYPNT